MLIEPILTWIIAGLIILTLHLFFNKHPSTRTSNAKKTTPTITVVNNDYIDTSWRRLQLRPLPNHYLFRHLRRNQIRRRVLHPRPLNFFRIGQTANTRTLVARWRRSILGLIDLANKNLKLAQEQMKLKDYRAAVKAASTSVENICRALIHCLGGKPDVAAGQEEVLRILSRRFKGNERSRIETALDNFNQTNYNRSALSFLLMSHTRTQLFDETITRRRFNSARETVNLFKSIITEHFAQEIPELLVSGAESNGKLSE